MKVVVLGGTAGLGRAVTLAAGALGHTLTVMARRVADFKASATGVRLVVGDVTDPADVERAVAGHDAVVWAVRPAPVRHGADAFEAGIPLVLAAMRAHGVPRLVCASCMPQRTARERLVSSRLGMGHADALASLDRREAPVRTSDRAWTLVRTGTLTDGAATGLCRVQDPAAGGGARIARADVASFIVRCLATAEHVGRTVLLTR